MKREIKFRGKRVDKGDWVFGLYCGETNNGCYCLIGNAETHGKTGCHVYPETVGQYTGLKDMNGKDIYEGDKLFRQSGFYTVTWSESYCGFMKDNGHGGVLSLNDCESEIIGNIHDNPELLEDH